MTNSSAKTCTKCRRALPQDAFARSNVGAGGLRSQCRSCRAQADRDYLLQRRFGMSAEQFDALLAAQGGRCALCQRFEPGGRWGRFHVDHCHQTGQIRGILCHGCNVALGALGDDIEGLTRALRYVSQAGVD